MTRSLSPPTGATLNLQKDAENEENVLFHNQLFSYNYELVCHNFKFLKT